MPAAILWFGLTDATIYFVVLAGSIPSIANGLVAGIDQIPPILPRVGQVLGARGLTSARHILLPAALPGYIAGCKQGWAFSWRSLMAAEIIAAGPLLGYGLGRVPQGRQRPSNMPGVIAAIFLILIVGIGIELLIFRPIERRVLRARGLTVRDLTVMSSASTSVDPTRTVVRTAPQRGAPLLPASHPLTMEACSRTPLRDDAIAVVQRGSTSRSSGPRAAPTPTTSSVADPPVTPPVTP